MTEFVRVELPIVETSKINTECENIGELKERYPSVRFVKYIYLDPKDNKLKGANPPDDLPIVAGAYITVVGSFEDVIKFATDATK